MFAPCTISFTKGYLQIKQTTVKREHFSETFGLCARNKKNGSALSLLSMVICPASDSSLKTFQSGRKKQGPRWYIAGGRMHTDRENNNSNGRGARGCRLCGCFFPRTLESPTLRSTENFIKPLRSARKRQITRPIWSATWASSSSGSKPGVLF